MKFLKKASLAASIAALSFAANAELVAMDEMSMAAATGQSGIDLDITLTGANAISAGEIVYTDTDEGGQLAIRDVTLGTDSGSLTLTNTIDIDANGNLNMAQTSYVSGLKVSIGDVETRDDTGAKAASLITGVRDLNGDLVTAGLTLTMDIAPSTTTLGQSGTDTTITHQGQFKITDGSANLLNGAIGIGSISFTGSGTYEDGAGNVVGSDLVTTDITMTANNTGLAISINSLQGDLKLGAITMGQDASGAATTVGDLTISNLTMAGANIKISGH